MHFTQSQSMGCLLIIISMQFLSIARLTKAENLIKPELPDALIVHIASFHHSDKKGIFHELIRTDRCRYFADYRS